MKSNLINIFALILISGSALQGQSLTDDFFRSTGKINTVLAVVVILFVVLIAFLVNLDLRLKNLEKLQDDE